MRRGWRSRESDLSFVCLRRSKDGLNDGTGGLGEYSGLILVYQVAKTLAGTRRDDYMSGRTSI